MSPIARTALLGFSFAGLALTVVGTAAAGDHGKPSLTITSPQFANGGEIPSLYTCRGSNLSPPLEFKNVPARAKTLALIVEDPDANEPPHNGFTHWVVFDIPTSAKGLAAGAKKDADFPRGTREGINDAQLHGYTAPCPPRGVHHYEFKLYALDERIERQGLNKIELEDAMSGHVLAHAELVGLYHK